MTPTPMDRRRPRRRWFQCRLRTLLFGITIVCVALGAHVERASRQRRAAEWLAERGFRVLVSSKAPKWMPNWLDRGFFNRFVVDSFGQGRDHVARGEVLNFGRLDHDWLLSNIDLFWVADTWTEPRPPPRPRALPIGSAAELSARLSDLGDCRGLLLQYADFKNGGLGFLTRLERLEHLDLGRAAIGDDDLRHLARLRNLRTLNLSETRVTDSGLPHLTGLTRLENLILDRTSVGDESISHLKHLRGLRKINLDQTRFSNHGRKALARALPDCRVNGEMPVNGL